MYISQNAGTPQWIVYHGKSYSNGWLGGTQISGNLHTAMIKLEIKTQQWMRWWLRWFNHPVTQSIQDVQTTQIHRQSFFSCLDVNETDRDPGARQALKLRRLNQRDDFCIDMHIDEDFPLPCVITDIQAVAITSMDGRYASDWQIRPRKQRVNRRFLSKTITNLEGCASISNCQPPMHTRTAANFVV